MDIQIRKRGCSRLMLLNMRQRESYQRQFYTKHGWEEREDAANFVYLLHPPAEHNTSIKERASSAHS